MVKRMAPECVGGRCMSESHEGHFGPTSKNEKQQGDYIMYGQLIDVIPKKFASMPEIAGYQFCILSPIYFEFKPSVVRCGFRTENKIVRLAIPLEKEPLISKALIGLSNLPKNGNRPKKYLDLFQIHELLGAQPEPDQLALRHAFAHAPEILKKASTIQNLKKNFGSVYISGNKTSDQRQFWRIFGQLLIKIDKLLSNRLELIFKDYITTE